MEVDVAIYEAALSKLAVMPISFHYNIATFHFGQIRYQKLMFFGHYLASGCFQLIFLRQIQLKWKVAVI